jgi:glycyl-tRNA synthetase
VNFKNVLDTTRMRIPFGIAQVGKAFRNEITPGNFMFRLREFEQMEIEYFVEPGTQEQYCKDRTSSSWKWWTEIVGVSTEKLRLRDHEKDELAFYST